MSEKQTLEELKREALYLVDKAQALANAYFSKEIGSQLYELKRNSIRDQIAKAVYEGKL